MVDRSLSLAARMLCMMLEEVDVRQQRAALEAEDPSGHVLERLRVVLLAGAERPGSDAGVVENESNDWRVPAETDRAAQAAGPKVDHRKRAAAGAVNAVPVALTSRLLRVEETGRDLVVRSDTHQDLEGIMQSVVRIPYHVVDLLGLMRLSLAANPSVVPNIYEALEYRSGLVPLSELRDIVQRRVKTRLLEEEVDAIYTSLEDSFGNVRVSDVVASTVDGRDSSWSRFVVDQKIMAMSVAFSLSGDLVARGSMDKLVRVFRTDSGDEVYARKCPSLVAAIALGSSGLGVGCFHPGHVAWCYDIALDNEDRGIAAWHVGDDVTSLAVDGDSLVASAGEEVVMFSLTSRQKVYTFQSGGSIRGLAVATSTIDRITLCGGVGKTDLNNDATVVIASPPSEEEKDDLAVFEHYAPGGGLEEEETTVILDGKLQLSGLKLRWLSVCAVLILTSTTITVLQSIGVKRENHYTRELDMIIVLVFAIEFIARAWLRVRIFRNLRNLVQDPLMVIDIILVFLDIFTWGLGYFPKYARLFRAAKTIRLLRIARFLRAGRIVKVAMGHDDDELMVLNVVVGAERAVLLRDTCKRNVASLPMMRYLRDTSRALSGHADSIVNERRSFSQTDTRRVWPLGNNDIASPPPPRAPQQSSSSSSSSSFSKEQVVEDDDDRSPIMALGDNEPPSIHATPALEMRRLSEGRSRKETSGVPSTRRLFHHDHLVAQLQRFKNEGMLREHDKIPVKVRATARHREKDVRKYVCFGGDTQHISVWCCDLPLDGNDGDQNKAVESTRRLLAGHRRACAQQELQIDFENTVNSVAMCRGASLIAGGDQFGTVLVFDVKERCPVFKYVSTDAISMVSLSSTGDVVAFSGETTSIQVHHVKSGARTFFHGEKYERAPRSVALSPDGKIVACGGCDARMQLYRIDRGAQLRSTRCPRASVLSVSTCRDGTLLAVGADDGTCFVYDMCDNATLFEHVLWRAKHKSKVWVVTFEGEGNLLAAADCTNEVIAHRGSTGEVVWRRNAWTGGKGLPFTRALSFSGDGRRLAVGKWDSFVYVMATDTWTQLFQLPRGDRVFSVAMNTTGTKLAVGGRDKKAVLRSLAYTIPHSGPRAKYVAVWSLEERDQTASSGTSVATTNKPKQLLQIPRADDVQAISMSEAGIAFSAGSLISVYGNGGTGATRRSRPSFEVPQIMLDSPQALETMLASYPSIVNVTRANSGETLLQYAVRAMPSATVERMLRAETEHGLVADYNGMTALKVALTNERKVVLGKLLEMTMRSVERSPLAPDSLMENFGPIANRDPDVFLSFLRTVELVREDDQALGNRKSALLPKTFQLVTAGSHDRMPRKLWDPLLVLQSAPLARCAEKKQPGGFRRISSAMFVSADSNRDRGRVVSRPDLLLPEDQSPEDKPDDDAHRRHIAELGRAYRREYEWYSHALRKVEVIAARPDSFLALVARAANAQADFDAYRSPLVQCVIEFKWRHYVAKKFQIQFALSMDHLAIRPSRLVDIFFIPVVVTSVAFLTLNIRQLLVDGTGTTLSDDLDHVLDLACFSFQLTIDYLISRGHQRTPLRIAAAISMLLLFYRILLMARGFDEWNSLIRMMLKMAFEVQHFLQLVVLACCGFAAAFSVLFGEPPSLWLNVSLINNGMYAQRDSVSTKPLRYTAETAVFIQLLMLVVTLLLLSARPTSRSSMKNQRLSF
ncbi:hypothetical protein CTAYLR_002992 [Chrysophaeum taylorii]|uniref:Ion transport domain-containing protein n=1 Tax=Chrysophaeum taylorii TaxID=2483200 RepID=A0AAD7U5W6_9STRA|nr:hypothetical protein CTAYLR_002992 [Chrysophaeum taylorii]